MIHFCKERNKLLTDQDGLQVTLSYATSNFKVQSVLMGPSYLAGQMVDLVGVLTLGEAASHQRDVLLMSLVVGLVLEDLHPLPAPGLGLGGFGHGV